MEDEVPMFTLRFYTGVDVFILIGLICLGFYSCLQMLQEEKLTSTEKFYSNQFKGYLGCVLPSSVSTIMIIIANGIFYSASFSMLYPWQFFLVLFIFYFVSSTAILRHRMSKKLNELIKKKEKEEDDELVRKFQKNKV